MSNGTAWSWCPVSFPDSGRGVSFKAEAEVPVTLFKSMTDAQILQAAKSRLPRRDVLALLTEGCFRGLLNSGGEARLLELLQAEEEERIQREDDRRFRARFGGLSRQEVAALGGGR